MLKKLPENILFLITLFASFAFGISSCSNNKESDLSNETTKNEIKISSIKAVAALGRLSPNGEIRQLAAPITEFGSSPRIKKLLVDEGDFVEKQTILAVFENREKLILELEKVEKLLLTNAKEISLKKDQIRIYQLAIDQDAYPIVLLSQRKDELLKLEKQRIEYLNKKKNIEIDLYNSQLRSPIDGYILSINTRVGERPGNRGILEIGASQKMQALIEVYESDIDRVFIYQNVDLISENGGFNETLKGKVVRISPQVKQRNILSTDPTGDADARIIEVLVSLDNDSIEIVKSFSGMKVIARFRPR